MRRISLLLLCLITAISLSAQDEPALRRTISPEKPMLIVHIDTWNTADPERIIEMVPKDILPYVCFNLSLSATDATCISGPNVCDSWMKACASKGVWTMIQPSSGAHNRFSDTDFSDYERYFKQYPNFLGWNFAEQFWDFGADKSDGSGKWPTWTERLNTLTQVLKICHNYGGYLVVSFTQAYYSADMMPIAYMKLNTEMRSQLRNHPENFICCEKYTMKNGFFDIESNCLGAFIGGYAGQLGIRYDACGWLSEDENKYPYVKAAGAIPVMEHVMLNGMTVIDGPETIPVEISREVGETTTSDGYTRRNWAWFPHFTNIFMDEFRKILDGTVRIPTKKEVIDRTKIVIRNDINNGTFDSYLTHEEMFDGLYRRDDDRGGTVWRNRWIDNRWFLKKTGRYPAFPQVYYLYDEYAKANLTVVLKSQYKNRWSTNARKVAEFNKLFPEEYTGDIFASHIENSWMTYNPYQYDEVTTTEPNTEGNGGDLKRFFYPSQLRATGTIPLQYNTATSVTLKYAPYSMAVMKEYTDSITFYMMNYNNSGKESDGYAETSNRLDTIIISGITGKEPVVTMTDRASHRASAIKTKYADGTLEIEVSHNGPLDLKVVCSGDATDRKTEWTPAVISLPEVPEAYYDTLQYEAECMDTKNIDANRKNGYYHGHAGYQGQGFVEMGTKSGAILRDTIYAPVAGTYKLAIRYQAPTNGATYRYGISGTSFKNLPLKKTAENTWTMSNEVVVTLKKGANVFKLQNITTGNKLFFDCVKVSMTDETKETVGVSNTVKGEATALRIEYYDIAGRRISRPNTGGITIRRTYMSDGSVRTQKF